MFPNLNYNFYKFMSKGAKKKKKAATQGEEKEPLVEFTREYKKTCIKNTTA